MKRRDFLRSASAAAVLPMMPLPVAAAPAAATPVNAMQVGWAALYARVNDRATPALLQKWLRVSPDQAQALMGELVSKNIITAPVAGSATAIQPMYPNGGLNGMFGRNKTLGRKAREVFDALTEDDTDHIRADVEHDPDVDDTPDMTPPEPQETANETA